MSSYRTSTYQISECLRLASYINDGERLYSNEEIAARLGETPEWILSVLASKSPHAERRMPLAEPRSCPTNMIYDAGKHARRATDDGQAGEK